MLKTFLIFLSTVWICSAIAQPQNLLLNGNFAEGLKYWSPRNPNGVSVIEKGGPNGSNALKLVSSKEHAVTNYMLSGPRLKPDTDYTVTAQIKTEGNAKVYLYFCHSRAAAQYSVRSQVISETQNWTRVSVILNSGKAKGLPVICRVIGPGTAYFADIVATEGNNMPVENLFKNSDFKTRTRYNEIPDGWTPAVQTGIARPENYSNQLVNVKPPVPGAGVLKLSNVLLGGQKIQQPVPGQTYTYSFYAKNATPGSNTEIHVRFSTLSKREKLTDDWKRYSYTDTVRSAWPTNNVRAIKYDAAFYFSAPQFVIGNQPRPWAPPKGGNVTIVTATKEAVAEAESKKLSDTPTAEDWSKASAHPIIHISKGAQASVMPSNAKILHNDHTVFVRFEAKSSPEIDSGNTAKLDWENLADTFEIFLTDTASDGTYLHYAVNRNGHDYTARQLIPETLGIQSNVIRNKDSWIADVRIPLALFRADKDWKIAFGRCYHHAKTGRTALDWSLPRSRHNPANFGMLKGISVTPVAALDLDKLYAACDNKKLVYEFSGFKREMTDSTLEIKIELNGKTLWRHKQPFQKTKGEIVLPHDYEKMLESTTRIVLEVVGKNGKKFYQASRVLYLLFSSYARHNNAMEVYPKFDLFTEKDKHVELIVHMDKKLYDKLKITLLNASGKAVYQAEASTPLLIPTEKVPNGAYKVKVEAMKNGKVADVRSHESFTKLPFRPEIIRINRKAACLASTEGNLIPMAYYGGDSSNFAMDPDFYAQKEIMFDGVKKANFTAIKVATHAVKKENGDEPFAKAVKYKTPYLFDMANRFPRGFYTGETSRHMNSVETEKIMIDTMQSFHQLTFGKPGILAYAAYHEPGYARDGKGIVDSHRVASILPKLKKNDPYRPITGFWAPPHWDMNGEPFGSIDGVDFFIVDIYTRMLHTHCDELFRISKASRVTRRPIGQIFNIDNQGSDERECPTPAEYRAEVYAALIAGYRIFYNYIGIAPVRETHMEMVEVNRRLPIFAKFLCDDACREMISVNEPEICYTVYERGKEILVLAASKRNDAKTRLRIDLKKLISSPLSDGREMFDGSVIKVKNGIFDLTMAPAGSGAWILTKNPENNR